MRVVQLLPALVEGGVERGVVESNREYVKRGIESFVISSGGELAKVIEKDGGVHIPLDVKSKNILTFPTRIKQLQKLFKKINPSILHARSRVPAWLSYFAKGDIPLVTTVHGFNSVNFYSSIMTKGDKVICVSNPLKNYIQLHYNTPSSKIEVIHRGVDLKSFDPKKVDKEFIEKFKAHYNLEGKFILTSVGRITSLKGYELFLHAVAKVKKIKPNTVGLIVGGVQKGKEGYFKKLQRLNKRLNSPIIFVGSTSKVAEIYSLSDLVVNSSLKPESFGRSLVEAMAMETPAIAPAFGGALDILSKENLFIPKDVESLTQTILNAKKETKGLREEVKNRFSLEQMITKTLQVYRELL
ncbi:MAG: glycosyltransferase family 4 protein [Epsilonproteobacteria bacterium]|nr:glycosyltransferase family 4 protein [Campylobacterota bacterium]